MLIYWPTGSVSAPITPSKDAVQAHCGLLEEDGTRMSPALPSAQPRPQPPKAARRVGIFWLVDWSVARHTG